MVSIAKSNLFHQKTKTLMSISGVIMSVFLVFTIYGVYNGMDYVMETMIYQTGADLWITQEGTSGSVHSPSILPLSISNQLDMIDGIEEYTPLIRTAATYEFEDSDILLFINSFNSNGSLGKPWNILEGVSVPGIGEIIIDNTFSRISGLFIGDQIDIQSKTLTVAGISGDGNMMVGYVVFLNYEDASELLLPGLTNGFIVKVEGDTNIGDLSEEINSQISNVEVQDSYTIAEAYKNEVLGGFVPIIIVLSALSLFVGVLVIGLLIYMLTLEKSKEYGIIKAMGATNMRLYGIVLSQSLIISIVGYLLGCILSFPLTALIQYLVPEFFVLLTGEMLIIGFPIFILTGIIASFIPVKKISSIDPALVFNS